MPRLTKSAWPAWAVLLSLVIGWDLVATRYGFETMSACWRRWGKERPVCRQALIAAPAWLEAHLR